MNVQVVEPLVEELDGAPHAATVFSRLAHLPHCLFLDSAMRHPRLGRYSFIAADPFDYLQFSPEQDAFGALGTALARFRAETVSGLPPFQGGVAGVFGYDLGRQPARK